MTLHHLIDAIALALSQDFPGRTIYREFCPLHFERPSFLLWLRNTERRDLNISLVEWNVSLRLEIFGEVDNYHYSATEALRAETAQVLDLFCAPKLLVSNLDTGTLRHISLSVEADGAELGSAFLSFQATWVDARATTQATPQANMQHYTLRHDAVERTEV